MPIYEYRCEPCDHTFEALVRSSGEPTPKCPACGRSDHLAKQFSVPAAAHTQAAGSSARPSLPMAGGCGAPICCGGGGCAID